MKRTFVISGFPCVGKSYCCNEKQDRYVMLDSDSSNFSWVKDENGINTKERNPNFPNNYINHIKDNLRKVDVIFVSSHAEVRKALYDNNIKTVMIYPDRAMKSVWIKRLKNRKSPEGMINLIADNWYNMIDGIHNENYRFLKIVLNAKDHYITFKMIDDMFKDPILSEFLN